MGLSDALYPPAGACDQYARDEDDCSIMNHFDPRSTAAADDARTQRAPAAWLEDDEDSGSFRWLRPGDLLAFPVPTAALHLDALLRHLEIDGEFADWTAAAIHLAQARATWHRLAPAVALRTGGRSDLADARAAAADMDGALDAAARALRGTESESLVEQARRAIALVEAVERALE